MRPADALADVRRGLHERLLGRVDAQELARIPRAERRVRVRDEALAILRDEGHILPQGALARVVNEVSDAVVGLGPIEFLLKDGTRRSFSMGNAPHDDAFIQLHVRHVPGGQFTDHVFGKMKERDILRFEGPHGTFFLREDSDRPVVFVASGTGFAPIKAILEYAFNKGIERPMTLYWGGRRPKDLYLHALAEGWAGEHANFRYVPVVSDALPEDAWSGRTMSQPVSTTSARWKSVASPIMQS